MLTEASDFLAESDALAGLLQDIAADDWEKKTQFKEWTVNDVLVHIHFWNRAADLSLTDERGFASLIDEIAGNVAAGTLRTAENARISERGTDLFHAWREFYREMAGRWLELDPKKRVKWAGPDMSVRSSITARQMESWAHGQEIFDLFAIERKEADRIRNIVVLGINTYQWSFSVRGLAVPGPMPRLELTAPSGQIWSFGESGAGGIIKGRAVDFCRVVTQTRNVGDTELEITGRNARLWMDNAQCFAGPAEAPPARGSRG